MTSQSIRRNKFDILLTTELVRIVIYVQPQPQTNSTE